MFRTDAFRFLAAGGGLLALGAAASAQTVLTA